MASAIETLEVSTLCVTSIYVSGSKLVSLFYDIEMTMDSTVKEGSDIDLICNLHNKEETFYNRTYAIDSSMLVFSMENKVLNHSDNVVQLLNDTAAQIKIRRARLQDAGTYYCYLDIPVPEVNITMVCGSKLTVGCKYNQSITWRLMYESGYNRILFWFPSYAQWPQWISRRKTFGV